MKNGTEIEAVTKQDGEMRYFYKVLLIIVAISIPAVSMMSAFNIVFRLPDLYIYEFNKNQVTREMDLEIKDDELGHFFSEFMKGKEKEFVLVAEYSDGEQSVFGRAEQVNMENARTLLNHTLYVLGGAAVLALLSYWFLLVKKKKYELRFAFKGGVFVFAAMLLALWVAFFFGPARAFFFHKIFIRPFGPDDVLPLMLTGHFAQLGLLAVSAVALIILAILASVTWRLTKARKMFG